jgi:hypothetical protein
MDHGIADPAAIDAEVHHIRRLGIDALRQRWRVMFSASPPKALSKDLIARMIAYRIQEQAYGGLDRVTLRLLDGLAQGNKPRELNRRLKPGTVLVREYRGERHTVTVVPNGFLWREETYSSLSLIARGITGTAWNGPRFFGLRMSAAHNDGDQTPFKEAPAPKIQRARRTRSSVRASGAGGLPGAADRG